VAGLLAVLAVAVRNDVMVIGRFRKLRAEAGVPFGPDLLVRGTREGLAPTVMTVLTTAIVLLPALVFGDIAGEEIVRPMAVVMLGGLVTSTLVSLFLLPALYMRFGPREEAAPLQLGTTLDLRERPPTAAADVGAQLTRRGR
jgi:Cu/Ag efflux pump CusA